MKYFIRVDADNDPCFIDFCKRNKITPLYIDCAWGTGAFTYLYTLLISPDIATALKLSTPVLIASSV